MQTTNVLIKKPKKIQFSGQTATLYQFAEIVSKASYESEDDEYNDSYEITYLTPKAIVTTSPLCIYFNNNHPNVDSGIYKYGRDYYGIFCLGSLRNEITAFLGHKKFPEIVYNTIAEYSDGGYWHPDDSISPDEKCVVCGRITPKDNFSDAGEEHCGCLIVDKEGYDIEFDACVTKKFSWSKKHNSFIYKGRIHDDYR